VSSHIDAVVTIKRAILKFPWHNFGLDEVGEADSQYAQELAERIARKLGKAGTTGGAA